MQKANKKNRVMFLFDLDGTITNDELLPIIAQEVGLGQEIEALTDKTMAGLIPFEESFKHRVGLLQKIDVKKVQSICEKVSLNKDILSFIQQHRQYCAIATGNLDVWIQTLVARIGIPAYSSIADIGPDGQVRGIQTILRKSTILEKIDRNCLTVAIGDGANDAELIQQSDVGIALGHVHHPAESLLEVADYLFLEGASLCQFLRQLSSHVLDSAQD